MITVADIRSYDTRVDTDAAQQIADQWNIAYPHMRAALTAVIGAHRYLAESATSDDAKTTATRNMKDAERVRRELGQLDRGSLRMCTRDSVGGFSVIGALSVVRHAIDAFSWESPHLGDTYRLAAALADVVGERTKAREAKRAATSTTAGDPR